MKVKWLHNGITDNITDYIVSISWGGSAEQAARTLDISVLYSPYDKNISDPDIKLGDRLKLYDHDDKVLINIMVYSRERNNEQGTITYSGYDDLNYLLRSKGTYNFKNVTPEEIVRKVCHELQIEAGIIAATGINIKSMLVDGSGYYDIIMKAYTKAYKSNGKKYMPIMYGRKLYIIEKGNVVEDFILNDKINITSSSYTESLDSMVNKIRIYNDKGKQIGEVKNNDWICSYGIFQDIYTKEDGINATVAANNILVGVDKTASVEALGNIHCVSGYGVKIKDTITGLTGTFWINSDTHTWENNNHTMSLELAFKNIMNTQEDDG